MIRLVNLQQQPFINGIRSPLEALSYRPAMRTRIRSSWTPSAQFSAGKKAKFLMGIRWNSPMKHVEQMDC